MYIDICQTFFSSLRSVGTAGTMAAMGIYLHQSKLISHQDKRKLALISKKVTLPAFLFTKLLYCRQNWKSDEPCPDITLILRAAWPLLLWPLYVVSCGLVVGWAVCYLTDVPLKQRHCVMAACAFGNSTGLPITLLTVIRENFPVTMALGRVDATLFLSVYLLLYPVLQWGIGGFMVSSGSSEENQMESDERGSLVLESDIEKVLESSRTKEYQSKKVYCTRDYQDTRKIMITSMTVCDDCDTPETELTCLVKSNDNSSYTVVTDRISKSYSSLDSFLDERDEQDHCTISLPSCDENKDRSPATRNPAPTLPTSFSSSPPSVPHTKKNDTWEWIRTTLPKFFPPPVLGALLGMIVACSDPLHRIFVDTVERRDGAPLEWLFDGLYAVGQAAIPLNMMILGCNLSASCSSSGAKGKEGEEGGFTKTMMGDGDGRFLSGPTMAGVVLGKMVLMPILGVISVLIMHDFVWEVPLEINASFYLVAMIVFITPTANDVMVMVELSDDGKNGQSWSLKEGIARVFGWQYITAPVLLSVSVTAVVSVASQWSA